MRSGEASESSKEISEAPSVAEAGATEYRSASAAPDDEVVSVSEFEEEAQLQSIDFRPGEKWRVRTRDGARNATMEDEEFLRELDRGMALHKGDIFRVTIREVRTTKNERTTRDWSLIKVVRTRRGDDDVHDDPETEDPSSGREDGQS